MAPASNAALRPQHRGFRQPVRAVAAAALAQIVAPTASLAADTKQACIDANEQAQVAQRGGRLREARERLVFCAGGACPAIVRSDCARLLADVTQSLPSVVVDARDESGAETTNVRMYLDGTLVAEVLNGLEIDLDPGEHRLRFESPRGSAREQRLVLKEGEKRRRVSVNFAEAPPRAGAGTGGPGGVAAGAPGGAGASVVPLVLLGIGAVGAAGFATFGILGYAKEKDLASSCAPYCTTEQIGKVKTDYLVADISAGIAVLSLGGALVTYLTRASSKGATAAWGVDAAPRPGGGEVSARFTW